MHLTTGGICVLHLNHEKFIFGYLFAEDFE